jgi:hypothetical protein
MNRCAQLSLALAGTLAALAPAHAAQGFTGNTSTAQAAPVATDGQSLARHFPQNALRGKVVFGEPPAIRMNGVDTHFAAGYRIHGQDNLILMSGQLVGSTAVVDYTTDIEGHVFEMWILTSNEAARLWPVAREQAAAWTFDPVAQTWTKP